MEILSKDDGLAGDTAQWDSVGDSPMAGAVSAMIERLMEYMFILCDNRWGIPLAALFALRS